MSWRIVVISKRAKLELRLNYLIVRDSEIIKIFITEISTIIIESTAVSLTVALLNELIKRKIKVIFCDEKRNPSSELLPYYGSFDTSSRIKIQVNWTQTLKDVFWSEIIKDKINKQANLLNQIGIETSAMLFEYAKQVEHGDITNREGHAAKVYFNSLFGLDFCRKDDNLINTALNYGYSILLSAFNREIVANGYLTQIGLFHKNTFNQFNLGCDLMESFRPLVEKIVYYMNLEKFDHEEKMLLVNILNDEVEINGKLNYVNNAIKIYVKNILDALEQNDLSVISIYK